MYNFNGYQKLQWKNGEIPRKYCKSTEKKSGVQFGFVIYDHRVNSKLNIAPQTKSGTANLFLKSVRLSIPHLKTFVQHK